MENETPNTPSAMANVTANVISNVVSILNDNATMFTDGTRISDLKPGPDPITNSLLNHLSHDVHKLKEFAHAIYEKTMSVEANAVTTATHAAHAFADHVSNTRNLVDRLDEVVTTVEGLVSDVATLRTGLSMLETIVKAVK